MRKYALSNPLATLATALLLTLPILASTTSTATTPTSERAGVAQ